MVATGDEAIASATCLRRDAIGRMRLVMRQLLVRLACAGTRSVVTTGEEAITKATCLRRDAIGGMRLVMRR